MLAFTTASLLVLTPALVVASTHISTSSTTSTSPPNPTMCGSIINKGFTVINATDAYECLRSVPFNPAVASQLLQYVNDTIQFHSTLAYLANPPPEYQQPAVDIVAGLAQIQHGIDHGVFRNEYDFEAALSSLLNAAHDDHLSLNGGILSAFLYGSPYDIASVSRDGIELPKLYIVATDGDWDNPARQPSAIATINGRNVVEYLTEFAARNSIGKLEQHAEWNMLMRSGALDTQGLLEVFFGGATWYPGDTITFTFENGSVLGPEPWQAVYLGPPYTGPLETGGDFYNFFVLGLYPASYKEPSEVSSSTIPTPTDSSSSREPWWDKAYPTPEPIPQGRSDDTGLPRVFFLNESSIAVLSITQFSAYGNKVQSFVDTVKTFLARSKKAGLKKVVIDVQQNKGGQPLLAIEIFKLFFPSKHPFAGSRRRTHPVADALGSTITSYWENLTPNQSDYYYLSTNEWVITNRLDVQTEEEYNAWDDYFLSPAVYGGDNFTKVEQYNLTNTLFTGEAAGIIIDNLDGSANQPYSAQDIIILSDGLCSSACAIFMELMHHEAQVQTVVVGGRPDYTPMQAPSGTRGAAVYDINRMDIDITGALLLDNSTGALPLDRRHDFYISYASVNLRDQIRRNDSSNMPLQFRYEAADCRIFFTPRTWYNYANLWKYAADAIWKNSTLCIANATTNSAKPHSHPAPYVVHPTEVNTTSPSQPYEEEETPRHHVSDDPFNDILAGARPIPPLDGARCKRRSDCGTRHICIEIPNPQSTNSQEIAQKYCLRDCPSYSTCEITDYTTEESTSGRPYRYNAGYCKPLLYDVGSEDSAFPWCSISLSNYWANDALDTKSCFEGIVGDDLHCFFYKGTIRKCLVYRTSLLDLDDSPRYCKETQLRQFESEVDVEQGYYDEYGSIGYWKPGASRLRLLVEHVDDDVQFEEFFDSCTVYMNGCA
ncbi:hypothetical protein BDV11DRAFT_206332 [Aspergillus similis]